MSSNFQMRKSPGWAMFLTVLLAGVSSFVMVSSEGRCQESASNDGSKDTGFYQEAEQLRNDCESESDCGFESENVASEVSAGRAGGSSSGPAQYHRPLVIYLPDRLPESPIPLPRQANPVPFANMIQYCMNPLNPPIEAACPVTASSFFGGDVCRWSGEKFSPQRPVESCFSIPSDRSLILSILNSQEPPSLYSLILNYVESQELSSLSPASQSADEISNDESASLSEE